MRSPSSSSPETKDPPLVSIVIPCYNQGRYLAEAIESALAQTHARCEIIVVNDGSTDMTAEVARRYPSVAYIEQTNSGVSVARNRGMEAASGDCFVFLDADDRLLPHCVETGLDVLRRNPTAVFARGMVGLLIDGERDPSFRLPPMGPDVYREMLSGNFIWCTGSVIYRRAALEEVGGFDASPKLTEDLDLYFRIARRRRVVWHDAIVAEYRFHSGGKGRNSPVKVRQTMATFARQGWFVAFRPWLWRAWFAGSRVCLEQHRANILREARVSRCIGDRSRFRAVLPLVARFYPAALLQLMRRPRESNSLEFVVGDAPAGQRQSMDRGPLVIEELHPPSTPAGEIFNPQPDGSAALALRCNGADRDAVVFFDGQPLETMYGGSTLLTAIVPAELYREPRRARIFIRSL
ncbi:MAG TPA: glycosyltransferase family 2 protein [Thermoanaerobaculia bacterium]